jgi:DNA polymerase III epsilon subunit-like protein
MWSNHLPVSVVFCDVETTGFGHHDRIVSFGGIGMISRDLAKGRRGPAYLYLVFNPGAKNRRDAARIHGFSDSTLRLQDPSRCPPRRIRPQVHQSRDEIVRLARAHQACLLHHERIPRARARRQRFSGRGLQQN